MENIKAIVVNGPNGQQEYGIEDAEARENVQEIVEGAPEELNTFKEAFDAFKEGGDALAQIAEAQQANAKAIEDEAKRATEAEREINQNAIAADSMGYITTTDDMSLEFETLNGKSSGSVTFPSATTKSAGVMSAEDKKNLDNVPSTIESAITKEKTRAETVEQTLANDIANAPNLVLRALVVADGAEYNDTNEDITKTTPWGDSYIHKTKCYSFNGVGDITEAEMISIYNAGKLIKQNYYNYKQLNIKTTLNVPFNGGEANGIDLSGVYVSSKVKILCLTKYSPYGHYFYPSNLDSAFSGCTKLKKIVPILKLMFIISPSYYRNTFYNCKFLEDVKLDGLKHSISFAQSSIISKESILFAINKAVPTTAITITLHPDAYARLANDADIVAALEAQPLVTLVSA